MKPSRKHVSLESFNASSFDVRMEARPKVFVALLFITGKELATAYTGQPANRSGFAPAKPSSPLVCLGEPVPGSVLPNGEGSPARLAGSSGVGTPDAPLPSLSSTFARTGFSARPNSG